MRLQLDRSWIPLALVIAVGAALRLYGLDAQSLWNDELSSWAQYGRSTLWQVVSSGSTFHPPGYLTLMHVWVRAVGDSETQLRLPSAIAGIAALPAMYGLGKRLYGPAEGVVAAALTATTWPPIYFSQEARAYMFLFLLVVLSSSWLIDVMRALREERTPPLRATIGYILTADLAAYFHYFGLFFVALQAGLVGLLSLRRPFALRRLAAIYGVVLAGYLPWLGRAARELSGGPQWLKLPDLNSAWVFGRSLFNDSTVVTCLVLALVAPLLARAVRAVQRGQVQRIATDVLLLAWLVVPIALVYVRSFLISPAFGQRYLVIVMPAAYLLVARAVTQLPYRRVTTPLVATVLSLLLALHLVFVKEYYARPGTEQFREAAAYLVQHDAPDGKAVVLACAWNRNYFNYYLERLGSRRRVDRLAESAEDRAMIGQLIAERSPDSVWLLAGHKRPAPELMNWLETELRLLSKEHFRAAGAWHFAPRAAAPAPVPAGGRGAP